MRRSLPRVACGFVGLMETMCWARWMAEAWLVGMMAFMGVEQGQRVVGGPSRMGLVDGGERLEGGG